MGVIQIHQIVKFFGIFIEPPTKSPKWWEIMFMPRLQIKKVGNSAALLLTEEIMKLLAIHIGDEVDIRVADGKIIIQPSSEGMLPEQKLKEVTSRVFEHRKSAYQQLAKGNTSIR